MPATQQPILDRLVAIPGTDATAFVVASRRAPGWWSYTIFDGDGKTVIATDSVDLGGLDVTPEQVARIAYILDVDA